MRNPHQSIECDKRMFELKPILKKWCNLNRTFVAKTGTDCPWWYNERASISILAAAAWKSGHLSLEEFSTFKGRRKDKTHHPGRCDLKIRVRGEDFLFEAKQSWPRLSKKPDETDMKTIRDSILNSLRRASRAASSLKPRQGRRFGISFISPRISETEAQYLDERVDLLIDLLKEKSKLFHSMCWFFTKDWDKLEDRRRIYPGCIILIREVRKYKHAKKKPRRRPALRTKASS